MMLRPSSINQINLRFETYSQKILAMHPANLIAYWQMNETSGSVAVDSSGNGRNGAYTGVTLNSILLPNNVTYAPLFSGAAQNTNNIYSASFNAAFNGNSFTWLLWCRNPNFSDGAERRVLNVQVNGSNLIVFRKPTTNNQFDVIFIAGGTNRSASFAPINSGLTSRFFSIILTSNQAAGRCRFYLNGSQLGANQVPGTWIGSLDPVNCAIGGRGASATNSWRDSAAQSAVWNTELTPAECLIVGRMP